MRKVLDVAWPVRAVDGFCAHFDPFFNGWPVDMPARPPPLTMTDALRWIWYRDPHPLVITNSRGEYRVQFTFYMGEVNGKLLRGLIEYIWSPSNGGWYQNHQWLKATAKGDELPAMTDWLVIRGSIHHHYSASWTSTPSFEATIIYPTVGLPPWQMEHVALWKSDSHIHGFGLVPGD